MCEVYDAAFGPTADGARDMQRGGLRRTAGDDEAAQRLEFLLAAVDRPFELFDALLVDPRFRELLAHLLVIWRGE